MSNLNIGALVYERGLFGKFRWHWNTTQDSFKIMNDSDDHIRHFILGAGETLEDRLLKEFPERDIEVNMAIFAYLHGIYMQELNADLSQPRKYFIVSGGNYSMNSEDVVHFRPKNPDFADYAFYALRFNVGGEIIHATHAGAGSRFIVGSPEKLIERHLMRAVSAISKRSLEGLPDHSRLLSREVYHQSVLRAMIALGIDRWEYSDTDVQIKFDSSRNVPFTTHAFECKICGTGPMVHLQKILQHFNSKGHESKADSTCGFYVNDECCQSSVIDADEIMRLDYEEQSVGRIVFKSESE